MFVVVVFVARIGQIAVRAVDVYARCLRIVIIIYKNKPYFTNRAAKIVAAIAVVIAFHHVRNATSASK